MGNKKCIACNKTRANFNLPNEKTPTHCAKCKLEGMIDIKNKKCVICNKTIPIYNLPNEKTPTHCSNCKLEGMINIKDKKCIVCNKTIPIYNLPNEKIATHCNKCKLDGMVNIVDKKCIVCNSRATFNLPCMQPAYCAKHKTKGMISEPTKKCIDENCKEQATYGLLDKLLHCETHKTDDDILLAERECIKCKTMDILDNSGLCINICSLDKRFKEIKKYEKTKENIVVEFINNSLDMTKFIEISFDKILNTEDKEQCRKHRPDIYLNNGDKIIFIEVDENQHASYISCGKTIEEKIATENRRMFSIAQPFIGKPVVFIRYNPDKYKIGNITHNDSIIKRHEILLKWINYIINMKLEQGLYVKYLYYDNFNESNLELKIIGINEIV